ncbi:putative TonB-dependent receptor [Sphingobacterium sp. JB170]|nr:putative TonB-dependent receptor [Sphingobacterium sp. JB170]
MDTRVKINLQENPNTFYRGIQNVATIDSIYNCNVYNLYKSLEYSTEKHVVKAGARFDYTNLPTVYDETHGSSFWCILPPVNLQRKRAKKSNNLSYNQRIQRPNINVRNPSVGQSSRFSVSFGNPLLGTAISNNFDLSFFKMGKSTTIFGLGFIINDNNKKVTHLASSSILNASFANIGYARDVNVHINPSISKKSRIGLNELTSDLRLKGNVVNNTPEKHGFHRNICVLLNFEFQNKLQLRTSFNNIASNVLLQVNINESPIFSLTALKMFLNDKLTILELINYQFTKFYTNTRNLNTGSILRHAFSQVYYRSFLITLTYIILKLKSYLASANRTINADHIQQKTNSISYEYTCK